MKQNKKALSQDYLVELIILLVVLVVLGSFFSFILNKGIAEGSVREIRIQNAKKHSQAHIMGLDLSSELSFPIIERDVKAGDEIKESSLALVHDWSDLLKGREQLFPVQREETVYCVPGHYLKFQAKNKKIPLYEYAEFQRTKKVNELGARHITGDGNIPISEYISGYTTDKAVFEEEMKELKESLGQQPGQQNVAVVSDEDFFEGGKGVTEKGIKEEYAINTEYDYMTVFVYMKKGYWQRWLSTLTAASGGIVAGAVLVPFTWGGSLVIGAVAGGGIGGAMGGIIGYKVGRDKNADWDAGIFLVPNQAEILKKLKCDILPARGGGE